jgi:adenylate kinase family enzyme
MRVVGFIGPSGSGKSYRALWVAKERNIEYIIDDGLLIYQSRIIAGKSAKKEPTRIGSIKTALFTEPDHCAKVIEAIKKNKPEAILILGTSEEMVEKIASKLQLAGITEKVFINEVASDMEIQQAINTRSGQGKHVIPVPSLELKKDFSGYFLDPLQIFKRKGKGHFQNMGEKSVVRPPFSYNGKYTISDYAIYQVVNHIITNMDAMEKILRFRLNKSEDGVMLDMDVVMVYGHNLLDSIKWAQNQIRSELEKFAALNVREMYITAKGLVMKKTPALTVSTQ